MDASAEADHRYDYRLEFNDPSLRARTLATRIDLSAPVIASMRLRSRDAIPARGSVHLAYSLVSSEPARLEVFDIAGRVVERIGLPGASRSGEVLVGRARMLVPGVYQAVLTQGGARAATRLVIVR